MTDPIISVETTVTMTARLELSIQDFNAAAQATYKSNLASAAGNGIGAEDIVLSIGPSSITVVAVIHVASPAAADLVMTNLTDAISSSASQGEFIGFAVTEQPSPPTMEVIAQQRPRPPSAPRLPRPPSAPQLLSPAPTLVGALLQPSDDGFDGLIAVMIGLGMVCIGMGLLCARTTLKGRVRVRERKRAVVEIATQVVARQTDLRASIAAVSAVDTDSSPVKHLPVPGGRCGSPTKVNIDSQPTTPRPRVRSRSHPTTPKRAPSPMCSGTVFDNVRDTLADVAGLTSPRTPSSRGSFSRLPELKADELVEDDWDGSLFHSIPEDHRARLQQHEYAQSSPPAIRYQENHGQARLDI